MLTMSRSFRVLPELKTQAPRTFYRT